jgi:GT2 family glycosyltransferase
VALLRNEAAKNSKYGVIAWCDDDVVIGKDWLKNTLEYSKNNGWDVLGNKVFNPDGTRYWDRATLQPHCLVDYKEPEGNPHLYQSSAFFLVRKDTWGKVKWDETKLVFADKEGGIPEDVQYSIDLKRVGYVFHFNDLATVWHNDESYTEFYNGHATQTLNKDVLRNKMDIHFFLPEDDEFISLKGRIDA